MSKLNLNFCPVTDCLLAAQQHHGPGTILCDIFQVSLIYSAPPSLSGAVLIGNDEGRPSLKSVNFLNQSEMNQQPALSNFLSVLIRLMTWSFWISE